MSAAAELLACLDSIVHEATEMLRIIENGHLEPDVRREMKRRALALRDDAQEFFESVNAMRSEEPTN